MAANYSFYEPTNRDVSCFSYLLLIIPVTAAESGNLCSAHDSVGPELGRGSAVCFCSDGISWPAGPYLDSRVASSHTRLAPPSTLTILSTWHFILCFCRELGFLPVGWLRVNSLCGAVSLQKHSQVEATELLVTQP